MGDFRGGDAGASQAWALLRPVLGWLRRRAGEGSTWAGLAMIAVVLGSDPMQAHGLAQAISLIIGGGLVATGPGPQDGAAR
jgi:hypothetical protein